MHKVNISHDGQTLYVKEDQSLLEQLKENGYYVKSSCGGHASCSDCIVKILDGKENVNEPTFAEAQLLGNVFHITKERLSCQCFVRGEITLDCSNHNLAADEKRRSTKSKKVSNNFKVRKKEEVEKVISERIEKAKKKREGRDDESWKNHWEKDKASSVKKLGGGMRPKKLKDLSLEKEKK